ncbi:YcjX family protein [Shimia litoralis]|uniref:YcjX family protein n=1 Tax=Shimia litoralis TaxID=420403 RepID=A0A4U7N7K8_9RHOB|nr:YcjX family protein [Shimia litoralis]TKZ21643.1 YcjX family protein [Shimia litoralis]
MVISSIADSVTRSVETASDRLSQSLFEPVIRLGVTGLARSGKTVFITSLVANLLDRGRMPQLSAAAEGRIVAAYLQPQPDDTVPRFDFETHLSDVTGRAPQWPNSTRSVSELRLSLKVQPTGILGGMQGPRTVHLDIVDYPGEWLLDLGLMEQTFRQWSGDTLARIADRPQAQAYLDKVQHAHALSDWQEPLAKDLSETFTRYLDAARRDGYYDMTPGRFLLPGDLEGSPALTFAPLIDEDRPDRKGLWREMERRFDAYKAKVVKPFFRDHFSRIDRQIVLVDALGAIHSGPQAVHDLNRAMVSTLQAFRPGTNSFLSRLLRGKRVDKILFAATKADHLHHTQHPQLTAFMQALTREAADRAQFAGAKTHAMSLASVRATVEETLNHDGQELACVRGTLLETGKQAALFPGNLPDDPSHLLQPARNGAKKWLDQDYQVMNFAPAQLTLRPGEGPPHIRLDRAAEFLIGDRL